jgi:subtilisin family serine protease
MAKKKPATSRRPRAPRSAFPPYLSKLDPTLHLAVARAEAEPPPLPTREALPAAGILRPTVSGLPVGTLSLSAQMVPASVAVLEREDKVPVLVEVRRVDLAPVDKAVRDLGGIATPVSETTLLVQTPRKKLAELAGLDAVRYVEASHRLRPLCDLAHVSARLLDENLRPRVPQTGKGVLIGIVDSGIDAGHPAFKKEDQTRIVRYFDQLTNTGYTQEQIQAGNAVNSPDTIGHGTHVAGIAAGNGGGSPAQRYRGVALEADLAVVKTTFESDKIVAGVKYLFDLAAQRHQPCVVNLSLGGHVGGHDGSTLMERTIDQLSGPGRIVVASAGNEGRDPIHASTVLPVGGAEPARWTANLSLQPRLVQGQMLGLLRLEVWHLQEDALTVRLRAPNGELFEAPPQGTKETDRQVFFVAASDQMAPYSGDHVTTFTILAVAQAEWLGGWSVVVEEANVGRAQVGAVHAWIADRDMGGFTTGQTFSHLVGMPATAFSVIAVASYATRDQWKSRDPQMPSVAPQGIVLENISYFSSPGPTRDGDNKPEVAAPGQWLISALSGTADPQHVPEWTRLPNIPYAAMQGTSMAAPYVTGALALLLEKDHTIDWAEAKRRLIKSARLDRQTGNAWNQRWGYGKINVERLLTIDPVDHPRMGNGSRPWHMSCSQLSGSLLPLSLTRSLPMSLPKLADIYRQQGPDTGGSVAVHVSLRTARADEKALAHLAGLGLTVQTVVGNHLTGVIPADRLAELRHDTLVAAVEPTTTLRPHGE